VRFDRVPGIERESIDELEDFLATRRVRSLLRNRQHADFRPRATPLDGRVVDGRRRFVHERLRAERPAERTGSQARREILAQVVVAARRRKLGGIDGEQTQLRGSVAERDGRRGVELVRRERLHLLRAHGLPHDTERATEPDSRHEARQKLRGTVFRGAK